MGVPYAEVIGDPIDHSKSPVIHKFWLEKLGLEGDYRRCKLTSEELGAYFEARSADPDWRGCNVTMPHKQAVLSYVADREAEAEKAGAANTLVADGGRLRAFNTDASAVAALLGKQSRLDYPGHVATYVQIIGAGGAARAAVIGAADAGYIDLDVFNRTLSRAQELARWLGLQPDAYASPLEGLGPIRNDDDGPGDQRYSHIVINASSMGMEGNPPVPIDLRDYYPDTIVLDMVYAPLETPLIAQAKSCGLRTIDGLEVLVEQAAFAFQHLFGAAAPREHDAELRELLTR